MKQFNHERTQMLIERCAVPGGDGNNGGMSSTTLNEIIEIAKDCNCGACTQLLPHMYMALLSLQGNRVRDASVHLNLVVSRMGPAYMVEALKQLQRN